MPYSIFINVVNFALSLVVLFMVFDTIKRTKNDFSKALKFLFFVFLTFSLVVLLTLLGELNLFRAEVPVDITRLIFVILSLISIRIINRKVKEVNHDIEHNNNNKKHRKIKR